MKIGIVTFHRADNYGAVLQAYALQQVMIENGIDVKIVDYVSDYLKYPFAKINWKTKGIVAQIFTMVGEISRMPRKKPFQEFRKRLVCTRPLGKKELFSIEDEFDLFIAGSDQVWNPKITNFDTTYLLDFVKDKNKKGSYAASFGLTQLNKDLKQKYKSLLKDFCFLNVREPSALPLLKEISGRTGQIVIDPTLLLEKTYWMNLAQKPKTKKPYILTYQVGMNKELIKYAKFLSKKTGYEIYSIPLPQGGLIKSKWILDADPCRWLGYIASAEYVITDSFHGTALSIALEKEFFVCHSVGTKLNSRIDDLMAELEIRNHHITGDMENVPQKINYEKVSSRLTKIRRKSMEKIFEMCGSKKV